MVHPAAEKFIKATSFQDQTGPKYPYNVDTSCLVQVASGMWEALKGEILCIREFSDHVLDFGWLQRA